MFLKAQGHQSYSLDFVELSEVFYCASIFCQPLILSRVIGETGASYCTQWPRGLYLHSLASCHFTQIDFKELIQKKMLLAFLYICKNDCIPEIFKTFAAETFLSFSAFPCFCKAVVTVRLHNRLGYYLFMRLWYCLYSKMTTFILILCSFNHLNVYKRCSIHNVHQRLSEVVLSASSFRLLQREFSLVPELVWAGELRVCDQSTVNSPESCRADLGSQPAAVSWAAVAVGWRSDSQGCAHLHHTTTPTSPVPCPDLILDPTRIHHEHIITSQAATSSPMFTWDIAVCGRDDFLNAAASDWGKRRELRPACCHDDLTVI